MAELYERHHEAALRYARTITETADSAEDLASEAFVRTLAVIRTGSGPNENWRPYLLAVVRNTAMTWSSATRRTVLTPDFGNWAEYQTQAPSPDEIFAASAERHLVAEAYQSLPERWRTVLWHAVVEQQQPETIAPLLGLTPSGVSSLTSRAREGLRRAYLAAHVSRARSRECEAHAHELAALVGRPSKRIPARLARHLDECSDCRSCLQEMRDVNQRLRSIGILAFAPWGGAHPLGAAASSAPLHASPVLSTMTGKMTAIGAAVGSIAAATAVLITLGAGPVPTGPVPTGPVPTGPVPTGPVPTGPVPTGPVPTGPVPTGPVPTGPVPTGPVPTGPVPNGSVPASGGNMSPETGTPSVVSVVTPARSTNPAPAVPSAPATTKAAMATRTISPSAAPSATAAAPTGKSGGGGLSASVLSDADSSEPSP
ncbi:sigma-70 family RNA polymerase sigma factor [Streptomyces sp. NBC_00424]|uniref:RNA polymerase sigma factor n=1 Tax=Streptomyces sp. NBC_00424 TaxID=2903648 RepID=UPI002251437E|nr:sigma-70 family RNA polymerase sigma factor [Streptomyces sp. NBC_00424]MCX5077639.1 sigma-70 family RNA polymerase sigma factor [Streptomyces sp. NBC_00424]MCX5078554.1 sigma-70 family RNA polymerase sigma factor [Streptomyces sp. NBC_00424]MCX5078900.1 sigma-70 family RNA polymerase sigma factor [Streptomyces sp. NBC_00424]